MKTVVLGPKDAQKIALVHGLFTGRGFWLKYLDFFRDFRVYLPEVDYRQAINGDEEFSFEAQIKSAIPSDAILISHSVGCAFAERYILTNQKSFHIAPVYSSSSVLSDWSSVVSNKTGAELEDISAHIKEVMEFIKRFEVYGRSASAKYSPYGDVYFKTEESTLHYDGDHLEIEDALRQVLTLIENYV